MEDLPIYHRNHEIENASELHFMQSIHTRCVVNKFYADYGTDYNCEIITERQVTGKNFTVQLKGKETEPNELHVQIPIKRRTINRWLNRLEPTIIVAYIVDENKSFWTWFNENTVDLTLPNESFTIKIDRKNKWNDVDWKHISEVIEDIFSKKHLLYSIPQITDQNQDAWNLFNKNSFDQALPLFLKLLKTKPDDIITLQAIALCEYELHNYQKALVFINKALQLTPHKTFYQNKASILTEQGAILKMPEKIEEAISIYKRLIAERNNSDSLFYNLGSALTKVQRNEEAIPYLKKAVQLNPNRPEIWNNLGNAYLATRQHSLELECYNRALNINPNIPETLFCKGSTLFIHFNRAAEGLDLMLKSTQLTDRHELDNPYVFFWIAEAYLYQSDFINSKKWNDKGLNLFSTDNYLLKQQYRISHKLTDRLI